jgi:hypothetical protein
MMVASPGRVGDPYACAFLPRAQGLCLCGTARRSAFPVAALAGCELHQDQPWIDGPRGCRAARLADFAPR